MCDKSGHQTPVVNTGKQTYKLRFASICAKTLIKFFADTQEAAALKNLLLAEKTIGASAQRESSNCAWVLVADLVKNEINRITKSDTTPNLYAQVITKVNEITSFALSTISSLKYEVLRDFDSFTTSTFVTDEDLFSINQSIHANYDMILFRAD